MQTQREQHLQNMALMTSSGFVSYLKGISKSREVRSTNKDNIILVSHLKLFTYEPAIKDHFSQYGEVTKVTFMYDREFDFTGGPALNYTRTCLVEFATSDSVDLVIQEPYHNLNGYRVNVTKYLGRKAHEQLFIKGAYKLYLSEMPCKISKVDKRKYVRAKIRGRLGGKLVCWRRVHYIKDCNVTNLLEELFSDLSYNRIEIKKGANDKFNGEATIRFMTENDCRDAQEIAKEKLKCKTDTKNKLLL